jgi:dihydrofolate reductase
MRKVTCGLFHSLDGVVQDPFNFQFDSFDDDLGAELGRVMGEIDTVLMGRKGWQEWAGYWPNATTDLDFAGFINAMPKHVASRTLKPADMDLWQNSSLIEGDLLEHVHSLKAQDGGSIAVMSSISLVRELIFAGLLDEMQLITHPVIAGAGRHLFEPGDPTTLLELVDLKRTQKGNVIQTYRKKAA